MSRVERCLAASVLAAAMTGCGNGADPAGNDDDDIDEVASVDATIHVSSDRVPISPYIYGTNQDLPGVTPTVRRWGGNRATGYNWETNASNAGADWQHSSDLYVVTSAGLTAEDASIPGVVLAHHHRRSLEIGAASVLTLQMAGYVAADVAGPVSEAETAPSSRWVPVAFRKGAPFDATPVLDDDVVWMDELVNHLTEEFGPAGSANGVRWYSLDNEPALWPHTHPRIHPAALGAAELIERTVALATAVKDVDPEARIIGPALYGMNAYQSLQDAPDWLEMGTGYDWFIDYYLDRMQEAEADAGHRLLDVLDLHWYPEARGDHRITEADATTPADVEARLQAPRTLWDPTYSENSWIGEYRRAYLPLLPRLKASIDTHYPGTSLSITEYNYGEGGSVSGGLAQADVLGSFGRYGVDLATLWQLGEQTSWQAAAFRLYRDYDGTGGTFGDTSVPATAEDPAALSIWASIGGNDVSRLHVILINKKAGELEVNLAIQGGAAYSRARAWGFGGTAPGITPRQGVDGISGNVFSYQIPARTAVHLVIE